MSDNSKALAVITTEKRDELFPALSVTPAELAASLEETLAGESFGLSNIDKITLPKGGSMSYTFPSPDGEVDARSFKAVILLHQNVRTLWKYAYGSSESGEQQRPECASPDGRIGHGEYGYGSVENPTGLCSKCPMGQWTEMKDPKTGKLVYDAKSGKVKRQAPKCKQGAVLYLLLPGLRFPVQFRLPSTSLRAAKADPTGWSAFKYQLANSGRALTGIVTEISARSATSVDGIKYAIATFKIAELLDDEAAARAKVYAESLRPALIPVYDEDEDAVEGSVSGDANTVDAVSSDESGAKDKTEKATSAF